MSRPDLTIQRVRHTLKLRLLQVSRTQQISPQLLRVTLTGEDLRDFVSDSFDDHIKVFFPTPGETQPVLPELGPNGPIFGERKPIARDYTPRRYDRTANELDIEFVLHGEGPASSWAAQATPGQYLGVGGPRGSFVIPHGFDWYLLIGDETALPAIGRCLAELPAGKQAVVVIEVDDAGAELTLASQADVQLHWQHRLAAHGDMPALEQAVRRLSLPTGEGYVWAAGESATIQAVRRYLVGEAGIDKSRIRAASYWKRGEVAVHENLDA